MKNQSPSKKESSFLFSTSLIFDENIDKLWLHLKDLSAETKIVDFLDNFKFIKGENTWTSGNTFSIYWIGVSNKNEEKNKMEVYVRHWYKLL